MFEGFSPETADFLWGLRMNNERDWFMSHKDAYLRYLYEPMKKLAADISDPILKKHGLICKTSRIYRDMRLSPPTPYKESLWTCIRRNSVTWMDEPCLFFEITPEGCSFGFIFWQPGTAVMNEFRKEMTNNADVFLKTVHRAERRSGVPLSGKAYARPRNCENKLLSPYYSLRNFTAIKELPYGDTMFSSELTEKIGNVFQAYLPFLKYAQQICDRAHCL